MNINLEVPKFGRPADKTKECRCVFCADLCEGRPGWFTPGQATKAAETLGMTLVEFFKKHLTRDFYVRNYDKDRAGDHSTRVFYLSPAWNKGKNAGRTTKFYEFRMRGPCSLLTPNGCALTFEQRPHECRKAYGCDLMSRPECDQMQLDMVDQWEKHPKELNALQAAGAFDPSDDGGIEADNPVVIETTADVERMFTKMFGAFPRALSQDE